MRQPATAVETAAEGVSPVNAFSCRKNNGIKMHSSVRIYYIKYAKMLIGFVSICV